MIRYVISEHIARPPAEIWDFAVVHEEQNHVRWERQVIALHRDGPLVPGTRGVMRRKDWGRVVDHAITITEVVPERRFRQYSEGAGIRFDIAWDFAPEDGGTAFTATVEVELSGGLRLMQPVLALAMKGASTRIVRSFKAIVEDAA